MHTKKSLSLREVGQGLVEYALILALVSVVSMLALSALGVNIRYELAKVVCGLRQEEEGCDLPIPEDGGDDGVCADEVVSVQFIMCVSNQVVFALSSTCDGAQLDVQGYSALMYDSNTTWHGAMMASPICSGRPDGSLPTVTNFSVTSHHPDGNYKNYSISAN